MNERNPASPEDFFSIFHRQMKKSVEAYQDYLQNGKTFFYAKKLRIVNSYTITLLEENQHWLDQTLQSAASQLLEHYHVWRNKWDTHATENNPADEVEFAFQNVHTFPKEAASLFEEAYMKSQSQAK